MTYGGAAEDREPINEAGLSRRQTQQKKDDKKDKQMVSLLIHSRNHKNVQLC
jgi:hypothetical protein